MGTVLPGGFYFAFRLFCEINYHRLLAYTGGCPH